jgi:hypothetical protein
MKKINGRTYIGNSNVYLTERGEKVVLTLKWIVGIVAFLAVAGFLNDITTPEQCKVPFEELSQGCINLLYP